jgi:hypothetical protein
MTSRAVGSRRWSAMWNDAASGLEGRSFMPIELTTHFEPGATHERETIRYTIQERWTGGDHPPAVEHRCTRPFSFAE